MSDHRSVIAVSRHLRLLASVLLGLALVGCGPTANALRPTLPPRTGQPEVTLEPDGSAAGGLEPVESSGSGTPPPGIAVAMANFPQGPAYEVVGATATSTGFIAVGNAGDQDYLGPQQGVVWTSTDGSSWQQSVDPAFIGVSLGDVVAIGDDVYVVGLYSSCTDVLDGDGGLDGDGDATGSDGDCTEDPNAGTVIFRSSSGGPWEQLAQTKDIIQAEFDGIRVWDGKLVTWGIAADDNGTSTIWTSTDGLNWTPTADLGGLDPIDVVGVGGPGLVGFAGKYVDTIQDTELIGASSSDGIHFTSTNVPALTGTSIGDVISGPGGLAGIGYAASDTSPSSGVTVYSSDGTNWSQGTTSDGSFDDSAMNEIHSSAAEYIAVGSTITDEDMTLQTGRIWVSPDGQSWRSLGDYGGSFNQYGASAVGSIGLIIFTGTDHYSDDGESDTTSVNGWIVPAAQLGS